LRAGCDAGLLMGLRRLLVCCALLV